MSTNKVEDLEQEIKDLKATLKHKEEQLRELKVRIL